MKRFMHFTTTKSEVFTQFYEWQLSYYRMAAGIELKPLKVADVPECRRTTNTKYMTHGLPLPFLLS